MCGDSTITTNDAHQKTAAGISPCTFRLLRDALGSLSTHRMRGARMDGPRDSCGRIPNKSAISSVLNMTKTISNVFNTTHMNLVVSGVNKKYLGRGPAQSCRTVWVKEHVLWLTEGPEGSEHTTPKEAAVA